MLILKQYTTISDRSMRLSRQLRKVDHRIHQQICTLPLKVLKQTKKGGEKRRVMACTSHKLPHCNLSPAVISTIEFVFRIVISSDSIAAKFSSSEHVLCISTGDSISILQEHLGRNNSRCWSSTNCV